MLVTIAITVLRIVAWVSLLAGIALVILYVLGSTLVPVPPAASAQMSAAIVTGLTTVFVLLVSLMVWALLLIMAHIAETLTGIYSRLERQ